MAISAHRARLARPQSGGQAHAVALDEADQSVWGDPAVGHRHPRSTSPASLFGEEQEIRIMRSMIRHHWTAAREAETFLDEGRAPRSVLPRGTYVTSEGFEVVVGSAEVQHVQLRRVGDRLQEASWRDRFCRVACAPADEIIAGGESNCYCMPPAGTSTRRTP